MGVDQQLQAIAIFKWRWEKRGGPQKQLAPGIPEATQQTGKLVYSHRPEISAPRLLKQEDLHELEMSLSYTVKCWVGVGSKLWMGIARHGNA